MKKKTTYSQPRNRQKAVEPAAIRIRSARPIPIQWPTLRSLWRRIYQIALLLCVAQEAYAAIGSEPLAAYPTNGTLIEDASGYRNNGSGGLNNVGGYGFCWSFAPYSATNARNLNFNSGNVYPLNNNERSYGFSVRPLRASGRAAGSFSTMRYTFPQLHNLVVRAYLKAREEERSTVAQLDFEMDAEAALQDLARELHAQTWRPLPLDWFVNLYPTVREVFAPKFRDRIVSHVLYMMISPIFERYFVHDSFSCRVGKGTLVGIGRLEHHIRAVTDNYRHEAYALNYDIRAYFMSIDRSILLGIIRSYLGKHERRFPDAIDYGLADYIITTFLSRDPLEGCVYHGDKRLIRLVQPGKSLRDQQPGVGIPIGDVLNQLCSNIYLTPFDQFVLRDLRVRHAVRYVDDGKMLHRSRTFLEDCRGRADAFLAENLHLALHPVKTTITPLSETTYFLGAAIKPYRRYARNDAVERFQRFVERTDAALKDGSADPVATLHDINARLGYLSHFDAYRIIEKAFGEAPNINAIYRFTKSYSKAIIKKHI